MLMFMEKPSKKLYPDYYKVIQEPIDMLTIENSIRAEKYNSEEEILEDFKVNYPFLIMILKCFFVEFDIIRWVYEYL